MKLFVGLGNPGKAYAHHRHNVGFMALERIAERHGLGPWRKRHRGLVAEGRIGGRRVMLLMPQTYMNDSGQAVGEVLRYLKIAETDLYVFHDEIDLAPAKIKVKAGGGNAGHNGLRSISAHVGNDYARVRIGVGHPGAKELVSGYVLHDFARADQAWLDPMLDAIAEAAGRLAAGDEARFLTDVTRRLQQGARGASAGRNAGHAPDRAPDRSRHGSGATPVVDASAPASDASRAGGGSTVADPPPKAQQVADAPSKPAAAPQPAQRGGSLAESLKRWLRGRG